MDAQKILEVVRWLRWLLFGPQKTLHRPNRFWRTRHHASATRLKRLQAENCGGEMDSTGLAWRAMSLDKNKSCIP